MTCVSQGARTSGTQRSRRQSATPANSAGPSPEDFASARLLSYAAYQFPRYRAAAHHRAIAAALQDVEAGRCKRLMIFMPPRHGKTMLASEDFPAWYLGRKPGRQVIATTYAQDLADDIGRKVRNQLRDPVYSAIFPDGGLRDDSTSVSRFHTINGGVYYAVGVGGPITGRGADLFLIDDPVKGRDDASSPAKRQQTWDWYTSVALSRLMPGAAIVLIMTRWDPDDLAGRLLRDHASEGWRVLSCPAISDQGEALWPSQFSIEALLEKKRCMGSRDWASLYMQQPIAREGGTFKDADILRAIGRVPWAESLAEAIPDVAERSQSVVCTGVDLATRKGEEHDLTVLTTVLRNGTRFQVLHQRAERLHASEILVAILQEFRAFHADAGTSRFRVEDNGAQAYIVQMCKDVRQVAALGATPDEIARIHVQGHTTTATKRSQELGVPSVAAHLEMDRLDLPEHPTIRAMREEMLSWGPDVHTGDRLMSLWIACEGLRRGAPGVRAC